MLEDSDAKRELPAGFDSLYLHNAEAQAAAAAQAASADEAAAEAYRHPYVVFDPAQVLPRYVVHFAYHPSERAHRKPIGAINLTSIKSQACNVTHDMLHSRVIKKNVQVAEALGVLGPAASQATEKMLSDIGDAYEVRSWLNAFTCVGLPSHTYLLF